MAIIDNVLKLITQGAGTVNAITATLNPAIPANAQCFVVVRSIGLNNSTTVTFQLNDWPAYQIKARGNTNIRVGDTGFANYEMILVFNTTGSYWQLLNPATSVLNESSTYTNSQISALTGYIDDGLTLKEDLTNKSTSVVTDQASNTKYPSVKAVYDWSIASFMRKAITNVTPGTIVTGTTSITISQVSTVPGSYFEPGEILQLDTGSSYSSVIAQKVLRTYINTSESLTGAFLLAMSTQAANTRSSDSSRRLVIQDATTTKVYGVTNSAVSSELISTVDRTSHNISWTSEQKILNTLQLSNGGDSGFCDYLKLAP